MLRDPVSKTHKWACHLCIIYFIRNTCVTKQDFALFVVKCLCSSNCCSVKKTAPVLLGSQILWIRNLETAQLEELLTGGWGSLRWSHADLSRNCSKPRASLDPTPPGGSLRWLAIRGSSACFSLSASTCGLTSRAGLKVVWRKHFTSSAWELLAFLTRHGSHILTHLL